MLLLFFYNVDNRQVFFVVVFTPLALRLVYGSPHQGVVVVSRDVGYQGDWLTLVPSLLLSISCLSLACSSAETLTL